MKSYKLALAAGLVGAGLATGAFAQKAYGPGVTDTEIKIGNIMPYSGPASAYGIIGKAQGAYFQMINDQGGINGRKINFISYDAPTARRKRWSRRASSWKATTSCWFSRRSARRRTLRSRNT